MMEQELPNDSERRADGETLAAVVTSSARRLPDTTLALLTGAGVLGAVGAVLVLPRWWWLLLPPFAMLAAFGAWGIADRERPAAGGRRTFFTVVRLLSMTVGIAAALTLALSVLRLVLGTWIS